MNKKLSELLEDKNFHIKSCEEIVGKLNGAKMNDDQKRSFGEHQEKAKALDVEISDYRETEERQLWVELQKNEARKPEIRKAYGTPDNTPKMPDELPEENDFDLAVSNHQLRNFSNDEKGIRQAQITGNWFGANFLDSARAQKWCRKNGIEYRTGLNETTGSAGAYSVPTEVSSALVDYLYKYGFAQKYLTPIPMARDVMDITELVTEASAAYKGEATASDETDPVFGQCVLTAKMIKAHCLISSELDADSVLPIADIVIMRLGNAVKKLQDTTLFSGDGTSTYGSVTGILNLLIDGSHGGSVVSTSGHDLFSEIDIGDLNKMVGQLPEQFHENAKWICSRYAWAMVFQRLAANSSGNTLLTYQQGLGFTFLGYPIIFTDCMPKVGTTLTNKIMLLFGDVAAGYAYGVRQALTVQRSTEYKFLEDQITLKVIFRSAMSPLTVGDNSTCGALVGFQGYA